MHVAACLRDSAPAVAQSRPRQEVVPELTGLGQLRQHCLPLPGPVVRAVDGLKPRVRRRPRSPASNSCVLSVVHGY